MKCLTETEIQHVNGGWVASLAKFAAGYAASKMVDKVVEKAVDKLNDYGRQQAEEYRKDPKSFTDRFSFHGDF